MKLRFFFYTVFYFLFFILNSSCSDHNANLISDTESELGLDSELLTKAAFDGAFEWDRVDAIQTFRPGTTQPMTISLPWEYGSSQNIGISKDWLDPNAYHPETRKRLYSRENGWVLVYSNMYQNTSAKYFALYDKYTGLLRFFFYGISSSGGYGTSVSFWGISADKSTSLFNFTKGVATGNNVKINQPAQITTPTGTFTGSNYSSIGYKENNWYGLELECAYDPAINSNSNMTFNLKGWAVNKITLTGEATTTGNVTGKIKTTTSNSSGLNLSLSNMFNSSSSTVVGDTQSLIKKGETIDQGIAKK